MNDLGIFNRTHIMIDLETLSTRQNAIIIQIGACSFTFEHGIDKQFLSNVDIKSSLKYGCHFSNDTAKWWQKQNQDVFKSCLTNAKELPVVLTELNSFVGTNKNTFVWAQGAVFDLGILSSAYTLTNIPKVWKYYQEMDSRTVFNMLNVRNDLNRKGDIGHHNALNDACAQAELLISLFKEGK